MTTIFDIKLDDTHDLFLDGGDLAVATEGDILKQRLTIRLQFLFEEWFLDNRAGLPYRQFIFLQGSDLDDIYGIFKNEINETEGVEQIDSLNLTPDASNKSLQVDFSVNNGVVSESLEITI